MWVGEESLLLARARHLARPQHFLQQLHRRMVWLPQWLLQDYLLCLRLPTGVPTAAALPAGCISQPKHLEYVSKREYRTNYYSLITDQQADVAAKAKECVSAMLSI